MINRLRERRTFTSPTSASSISIRPATLPTNVSWTCCVEQRSTSLRCCRSWAFRVGSKPPVRRDSTSPCRWTRRRISTQSHTSLIALVGYWYRVIRKISRASFTKWIAAAAFSSTPVATTTAPRSPLLTLFVQDEGRPSPRPAPGRK